MPKPLDPIIKDVLSKYHPNPEKALWDCHGTWVVYHKDLELIAARAGISFAAPQILRSERDEAVILASGSLGERTDWEVGEALIGVNYKVSGKQAAYVYAMASKRARDRLILKLVGLHGFVYSEEESDDFKQPQKASPVEVDNTSDRTLANALVAALGKAESQPDLAKWFTDNRATIEGLPEVLRDEVRSAYAGRLHILKRAA